MPQNNANEGAQFTPQNIATTSDFLAYIERYFSGFSADDIAMVQEMYPSNTMTNPNAIKFSTLENTGPSALEISPFANGQQQRAYVSSSNLIMAVGDDMLVNLQRIFKLMSPLFARLIGWLKRCRRHGTTSSPYHPQITRSTSGWTLLVQPTLPSLTTLSWPIRVSATHPARFSLPPL